MLLHFSKFQKITKLFSLKSISKKETFIGFSQQPFSQIINKNPSKFNSQTLLFQNDLKKKHFSLSSLFQTQFFSSKVSSSPLSNPKNASVSSSKNEVAKKDEEMLSGLEMIKIFSKYIWPPKESKTKFRVIFSVGLLIGAKVFHKLVF